MRFWGACLSKTPEENHRNIQRAWQIADQICERAAIRYAQQTARAADSSHPVSDLRSAKGRLAGSDCSHIVPRSQHRGSSPGMAETNDYTAVIIDPIYKIITGDENSAEQMALFCNQFDRLCTELDTAVIYCHHHSKGAQGGKRAIDRSSGSGVFARDPDAILDMIELTLSEAALTHLKNRAAWDETVRQLDALLPGWRDDFSANDQRSAIALRLAAQQHLAPADYAALTASIERAETAAAQQTAWRIEATLREFPKFPPIDVWLDYPLHRVDDTGILADLATDEQRPAWQKASKARTAKAAARKDDGAQRFAEAVSAANMGDPPTVKELAEYLGVSEKTCRTRMKEYGYTVDTRTHLVRRITGK